MKNTDYGLYCTQSNRDAIGNASLASNDFYIDINQAGNTI